MTEPSEDSPETPGEDDDIASDDLGLGRGLVILAWREGDTTSTIDDALRDGPRIVGELAAEIADERGLPRDWMTQAWRLAGPPADGTP